MTFLEVLRKSYTRFKRIRRVIYIAIIFTMLAIGTWLMFDGRLQARISSVTFPASVFTFPESNETYIGFSFEIDIWNPSILTRFIRTANTNFRFYHCLDVTFLSPVEFTLLGPILSPAVETQILKPGINKYYTYYDIAFPEANLTSLPLGDYRMWIRFDLTFGQEVVSSAVNMHVFENETFVEYDAIPVNWGRISLFKSCLPYYLIGGLMVAIPLVNKSDKRRKKQLISK